LPAAGFSFSTPVPEGITPSASDPADEAFVFALAAFVLALSAFALAVFALAG
jgi:hypothetical protein